MTPKELPVNRPAALEWCNGQIRNAIKDGKSALRKIGETLKRVKDEELYLETHTSFAKYCEESWGFTGRRGAQLIDHSVTIQHLLTSKDSKTGKNRLSSGTTVPTNKRKTSISEENAPSESVTRELSGLEPDEQAEVYAEASEGNGKPPTAAAVKSVVKKRKNATGGAYKPPKKADKTEDQKHIEAADRCYVEMANHIYAYCRLASVNRAPFDKGLAKMHGLIQGAKR